LFLRNPSRMHHPIPPAICSKHDRVARVHATTSNSTDIGVPPATGLAGELGLQIRKPNVIAPLSGIHDVRVRAFKVAAIDDQPGRAVAGPHFPRG
jgi:hypothetical protein